VKKKEEEPEGGVWKNYQIKGEVRNEKEMFSKKSSKVAQ